MKNLLIFLLTLLPLMTHAQEFRFSEMEYTPQHTTFRLFAPREAKRVVVRIYNQSDYTKNDQPLKTVSMRYNAKQQLWTANVKGDLMGRAYTFDIGRGETPGVFAKAVGVNGKRAVIVDLAQTNPEGWESDRRPVVKSPADLIIYELHHRDFSIARNINLHPEYPVKVKRVATEYPGKFLALSEDWAVDYLKTLGVNAIHILPSYDFGSVDETRLQDNKYNWGYDPVNYNVPEGSYSTDPYAPTCRIREFKQMVQALHKAGIRVVLDVVFNHTYDIEHSNFQRTYPDYYYRIEGQKASDKGQETQFSKRPNDQTTKCPVYSNGSGCGNETASEQPMMRRFMLESVKHWINEYHIDGFRFDLMGVHDIETMNQIRKAVDEIDPTIFIYGEGWSAGDCALPASQLATKAHVNQMPGIAAFSDEIRDALRGPFSDDTKGAFLAGIPGEEESLKFGIAGAIAHPQVDMTEVNYSKEPWATEPTQMISYVSCHDDMCLVDRLRASVIDNGESGIENDDKETAAGRNSQFSTINYELIKLDLLAQTAVLTSQGVPFLLSGEELLRDKKGVHNSFESPDSINQLDWSNQYRFSQVFDYYCKLIQLRKNHPAFRLGDADLVRRHLDFIATQDCLVAFRLKDHAGGDAWKDIVVILNASKDSRLVPLREGGTYEVVAAEGRINEQGLGTVQGPIVEVAPQSAMIIHN